MEDAVFLIYYWAEIFYFEPIKRLMGLSILPFLVKNQESCNKCNKLVVFLLTTTRGDNHDF